MDGTGIKWSRERIILASDLHCKTSFRKISSSNTEIKELATLLDRTLGSVVLKMQNLAHFDLEFRKRNFIALSHGSKLDIAVWEEVGNNWEVLSYQARCILANLRNEGIDNGNTRIYC